jgi:hypothetical protein
MMFITYTLLFNMDGAKQKLQSLEQLFANRGAQGPSDDGPQRIKAKRVQDLAATGSLLNPDIECNPFL